MSVDRIGFRIYAVAVLLALLGCAESNTTVDQAEVDREAALNELRLAIKTFYDAYFAQNWDMYYTFISEDIVLVDKSGDVMDLAEYESRAAQDADSLGELLTDSLDFAAVDVRLAPDGNSGIAYSRLPYLYRNSDGEETTITFAETDVWWKIDGSWKVVHIHFPEVLATE